MESTVGRRKDEALIAEARDINPEVRIKSFAEGVKPHNVEEFLDGVGWIVDGVDLFAMSDKLTLHEAAERKGLPSISCASAGFGGAAIAFEKGCPSFAELSGIRRDNTKEQNFRCAAQFLVPEIPAYMAKQVARAADGSTHIPFAVPGVEIAAALVATHVSNAILGIGPKRVVAPYGMYFNPITMRAETFVADYRVRAEAKLRAA
jgi:molybdopterin/thiamine biosynthesis adenylyltransferase